MHQPKITVVIPVYNTEKYLDKCLSSVVNQTFLDIKVIIVNDGSTDKSLEICKKYALKDSRITLIDKANEGVSVARNIGIKLAEGEWIYFLDSDDFLDLDTFEYLMKEVISSNVDVIQFGLRSYRDSTLIREKKPSSKKEYNNLKNFLNANELKPVCAWLHLFKLEVIKRNNILFNSNLKHGEDMLFVYSVYCHANKILVLDKVFYNQVLSPNSASRKPIKIKVLFDSLLFLSELTEYVNELNLTNEFKQELRNLSKRIFIIPLILESKSEFKIHRNNIQDTYNVLYDENKTIYNKLYHKISRLDIRILVFILKVIQKFKRVKYA